MQVLSLRRRRSVLILSTALASFSLVLAGCGGGGSSASSGGGGGGTISPTGASGVVTTLVTDGASTKWSHLILPIQKIVLKLSTDSTKSAVVFDGTTTPAKVDFITLDGVAQLLAKATVPVGTYDTVEITVDTDSTHATLTDLTGTDVLSSKLKIDGGPIVTIPLKAPLVVTDASVSSLQVEFAINDPLFITTTPDGQVVVHLVLKHKETPADVKTIQLKEAEGSVTAVSSADFTITNEAGKSVTYKVDSHTEYFNLTNKTAGSFSGITVGTKVNIRARIETNGDYTATRVAYGTASDAVAKAQVDAHVFSVDTTAKTIKIYNEKGRLTDIAYDDTTKIIFKGDTTVTLPVSALQPGFLLHIDLKDGTANTPLALAINVQRALDLGVLKSATATGFSFSKALSTRGQTTLVTYPEATGFQWWYEDHEATKLDPASLVTLLAGKGTGTDDEPQKGEVELTWDATGKVWQAQALQVEGHEIEGGTITTPYSATTHTFTVTYNEDGKSKVTTYSLVDTGTEPTKVTNFKKSSTGITSEDVPVANWPTVLVTSVIRVNVASIPQSDGTFKARKISVYTGF